MNYRKRKTKSPFLFLLFLGVFGFICFKFAKVDKTIAKNTQSTQAEATSCSADIVDNSSDDSSAALLNIDGNGNITGVSADGTSSGSVLGITDVNTCSIAKNTYEASSACTLNDSIGATVLSGVFSTSAQIEMTSITAPIKLLSGIFSVKDSNREITNEDPVYKPVGEQFTDKQIASNTMPGDSTATTIIDDSAKQNDAYGVKYTYTLTQNTSVTGTDKTTISKYYDNDCGANCNDTANVNPDKSDKASSYLKNVYYDMPGDTSSSEESSSGNLTVTGSCNNIKKNYFVGIKTCFSAIGTIKGLLGNWFPTIDWIKCLLGQEQCTTAASIVVVMSPIAQDLNDYTSTRNKTGEDPETASNYEPFYVLTPCRANIYSGGIAHNVELKCAWDLSYLLNEREAAQYDDLGKSDTPSESDYVSFLQSQASSASESDAVPMSAN
jgi:hypothetical protein